MKTKSETDKEILEQASINNNKISEVRVRHTDSVHPLDCSCEPCKTLRFTINASPEAENEIKENLDWYQSNKPTP